MQLQLKTDFHDYYDHWFDREGQIFERMSHSGMSRREMFGFLEQIGLKTPPHGTPEQIFNTLSEQDKEAEDLAQTHDINFFHVVVYLDETAHRGEGKILVPLTEAMQKYPNAFCSLYYQTLLLGSTSLHWNRKEGCYTGGKFYYQVVCCIQVAFGLAVKPSLGGVIGYTAGDIRNIWDEAVPSWVKEGWNNPFDSMSNETPLWL